MRLHLSLLLASSLSVVCCGPPDSEFVVESTVVRTRGLTSSDTIQPGDLIVIGRTQGRYSDIDSASDALLVDERGKVSLANRRTVHVAGRTPQQAASLLTTQKSPSQQDQLDRPQGDFWLPGEFEVQRRLREERP